MKKILLSMAAHMVGLLMCAQSQLVVNTTNGLQTQINLDKKPVVTFGLYGDKVKISYGSTVKEMDVKDLTFDGVKAGSKEMVIVDGVMIPLASIKSIIQKSFESDAHHLVNAIANDPKVSIYYAALQATHMDDSLKHYMDASYTWANDQDRIDSCTWTNRTMCYYVSNNYDNVAYPEQRFFNFTAFLVPDDILNVKYGITSLDDLRQKAHELYDPMYPEDTNITDETDRRNALNRFISYHVLDRYGDYYNLTAMDNDLLQNNFNREKADITDWYETLMPYSIMKLSFPSGSQAGLYVNRRGVQSEPDAQGMFVRGAKVSTPEEMTVNHTCINGIYHYIDDIVAYDKTMQQVVCYDRIRLDATAISPDFMTKLTDGQMARGHFLGNGERYGQGYNTTNPSSNLGRCVGFKPGYVRNFEYKDNTHMHVRNRCLYFWSYSADELIIKGQFDVNIKLPSLPAGRYEIRLQTNTGFNSRAIIQAYVDGQPYGIPFDARPDGTTLFGWMSDASLGDEESIAAFDKTIHNMGWMKGAANYSPGMRSSFDPRMSSMRDFSTVIRKVVGTVVMDGRSDHYLRLRQMMDFTGAEFPIHFIEFIPVSLCDVEDIY